MITQQNENRWGTKQYGEIIIIKGLNKYIIQSNGVLGFWGFGVLG
jgi:hypothetical protein